MATNTSDSSNSSLSLAQALAQGGAQTAQNAGTQASPRADAIGIEIPVVLYASRYSAAGRGVSKTPPVREETRTVIVFAQGAVVRLTATLSVGEMVVLTNQQTGADVLCRVGAVKAQPGIQNYVDLEFTQRAPGFWEGSSVAGASARTESPSFDLAGRTAATPSSNPSSLANPSNLANPVVPAPKQPSGSPSWLAIESPPPAPASASPVSFATPASRPTAASSTNEPFAIDPPRTFPARTVAPASSSVGSGANAGARLTQLDSFTLAGSQSDWAKQSAPKSKKGLWAAVAAVAVASLVAGGFVLGHRTRAASSAAAITVAAPSAPEQQAIPAAADAPPPTADAAPTSSVVERPVDGPTWVPDTPKHEQAQVEQPPAEATAPPAAPAPRRTSIPVENLAAPISRARVVASSSEPPPVLTTQDNGAAEGVLRSGVLSGASGVEAPTAFPGVVTPPAPRPVGGKIQMPKLISSSDPLYPMAARTQSIEGVVEIDALVDATGKVTEAKAISGPITLRQAAMDAVRKWKYEPARLDGQPTSIHTKVNISFKLR